MSRFGTLDTSTEAAQTAKRVYPGVAGSMRRGFRVDDTVRLRAGQKVIIQPVDSHDESEEQEYIITTFSEKKEASRGDMPESHRDVEAGISHSVKLSGRRYLKFDDEQFKRSNQPLFPSDGSPSIKEIAQGQIPDCFLLAAIQSILTHPNGQEVIKGMMRQHEDGSTTVRLYDPDTQKPIYVRVNNSIIVSNLSELSSHKALWVHILEKAYASLGKKSDKEVDKSVRSVYSEGGLIAFALTSLTGIKSTVHRTPKFDAFAPWDIESVFEADLIGAAKQYLQIEKEMGITIPESQWQSLVSPVSQTITKHFALDIEDSSKIAKLLLIS